ncbi:MAG: putative glycoside hydrolase [Butyricicoccaceae bacterium]
MKQFDTEKLKRRAKIAGIVIGVLLIIALISFVLLVRSCLSFDETGAHVEDRFGILAMENGEAPEQLETPKEENGQSTGPEAQDGETEEQPKPDNYQDEETPVLRAIYADAESMANDDGYMGDVEDVGRSGEANAVCVALKDEDGKVAFELDSSVVSGVRASFSGWFKYAVEESNTAGLDVYAVLHCFRDSEAVESDSSIAVHTADGEIWEDADGGIWLDPTDEDVQAYLVELVEQSIELGAEEIILRDFLFPQADTALTYDEQDGNRTEQLMKLYSKLQKAAGDVPVSIWLDDPDADSDITGQNLKQMYRNAYRLYAPAESTDAAQALAQQIAETAGGSAHFVPYFESSESYDTLPGGAVCMIE